VRAAFFRLETSPVGKHVLRQSQATFSQRGVLHVGVDDLEEMAQFVELTQLVDYVWEDALLGFQEGFTAIADEQLGGSVEGFQLHEEHVPTGGIDARMQSYQAGGIR